MSEPVTRFTAAALAEFDRMQFDPAATYAYKHLGGGFVWSDEFPSISSDEWKILSHDDLYRYVIHIRRCITLGDEELLSFPLWRQLEQNAPHWPGLRSDRRTGRISKRLLAAERLAQRCCDKLFDEPESLK